MAEEREVAEEDTLTAEFQTRLRKLSHPPNKVQSSDLLDSGREADGGLNICQSAGTVAETCESEPPNSLKTPIMEVEPVTFTPPAVSRSAVGRRRGAASRGRGLQRSRTWQGFGSGHRYESVSDAGLPPPPPNPVPSPPTISSTKR